LERRGNTFKHFKDIYLKSKSIAVLHVPYLLDSGVRSHLFDALVEVEHAFFFLFVITLKPRVE